MQLRTLILALSIVAIAGCGIHIGPLGPSVVGTGPDKTDSRSVGAFTKVRLRNAIEATITVGGKDSVEIHAKESLLPLVTTRVEGGELIVETTKSIDSSTPVKAVIHVANLEALRAEGASTADLGGVKADSFTLKASGASHVDFSGEAKNFTGEASGASTVSLKGTLADVDVSASGASTVKAEEAKVGVAKADASGASSIRLGDVKSLDAEAGGASTIKYKGSPKIGKKDASGASTISGP